MNRSEIEQTVRMARAYVAEQLPWFAPALYAARLIISEACPFVAAIDEGMRVYFNPHSIATLLEQKASPKAAMPELGWLWFHEISHTLRQHSQRARERNAQPRIWNAASDLEVNDDQPQGLALPWLFQPLLPRDFHLPDDELAEFYYERLIEENQKQQESDSGTESESAKAKPRPSDASAKLGEPRDEGSGVHGEWRPWELPENSAEARALPDVERDVVRRTVAEEITRHKNRGTVPAGWLRWADEVLTPRVDWRELLKRRVRGAIVTGTGQRVDYSFYRPHRRAAAYAPVLPPSLHGDFLPRVACVVDTSGSISQEELAQALAEVRRVLETLRAPVIVIPCDSVPYEPIKVFTQSDFLSLCRHLRGGGGTDMVAGIEAALKTQPTPDTIIVLTDGYTPFPKRPYNVPIIFGIFDPTGNGNVPKPPIPLWREEDVVIIEIGSP